MNTPLADLGGEHRTEAVPPEPHSLVANVDAALKENIFDLPQRKRLADIHHNYGANNLS
jgi:hypothetical protein